MIKEEILAVGVGKELDKIIHEVIMGLCVHEWGIIEISEERHFATGKVCEKCGVSSLFAHLKYSTSMSAAWDVVGRMERNKYWFEIKRHRRKYEVSFTLLGIPLWETDDYEVKAQGCYEVESIGRFPEAICRAALLVKL